MSKKRKPARKPKSRGLTFQDVMFKLQKFWAAQGCILQQPYDVEMGAGTMHPETFLRVLGPAAYRVGYVQPSRRPTDGRYGENPNRLYKHLQYQVILKPAPANIQNLYLKSLEEMGIRLKDHDIRFEEDNWESPTLGAWGIGWQVLLDGLEITQFTYFQQCGGLNLDPVSVELTYGLERITAFLQNVDSVYDIRWNDSLTYGQVRLAEELQFSVYSFEKADAAAARSHFESYEAEAAKLLKAFAAAGEGMRRFPLQRAVPTVDLEEKRRFPLLAVYELCLKCSHLFNILDARGAISVTERAALIGRVRQLACRVAAGYVEQQTGEAVEVPA